MGKLRSNRVKRTPQTGITSDRYQFLGLEQAEPNLGDPIVGPSSVGVNPIKTGTLYNIAAVGQYPGERFWYSPTVGIGTSLGVISVYANNTLPNSAFQRIHGLNFVGTGVTLETPPLELVGGSGIGIATVRFTVTDVLNRGTVGQVLYNSPSGYAYGADSLYYVDGNVGIGSTVPQQRLDVSGNAIFSGIVTAAEFRGFIDGSNINTVGSAITATNVVGGIASVTSLRVSGISTLGIISASNAFLTGIITATRFVGAIDGPVLSNAATATTAFNVIGGIASVSQLYVSGISTFANGPVLIGTGTYIGTPNQLLQVNSGAYINGNLGIGTTNPQSTLHVVGNGITTGEALQVDGNIRVGISTTSNYIAFRGVYGDGAPGTTPPNIQSPYTHAFIGERIYVPGTELSELLIFKGNDSGVDTGNGPDRIRLAATGSIVFDTATSGGFGGAFEEVGVSTLLTTKMVLTKDGNLGIGATNPSSKLHVQGTAQIQANTGVGITQQIWTQTLDSKDGVPTPFSLIATSDTAYEFDATKTTTGASGGVSPGDFPSNVTSGNSYLPVVFSHALNSSNGNYSPFFAGVTNLTNVAGTSSTARVNGAGLYNRVFRNSINDNSSSSSNQLVGIYNHVVQGGKLDPSAVTEFAYASWNVVGIRKATANNVLVSSNSLNVAVSTTTTPALVVNGFGNYSTCNIGSTVSTSATVTNYYGYYVDATVVGSNSLLSNYYGLYLAPPSTSDNGTITNRYSIYSPDAASPMYHAGNLGIGTTNPQAALDVGTGNAYISNGDLHINGTPYIFNTRTGRGGYWTNGGTDGNANFGNVTPGGSAGFSVKMPGVGATSGTFGAPDTTNMYDTVRSRHDGTEGVTDFRGRVGIGTTSPSTKLHVQGDAIITGISTLGITSATDLSSNTLVVSGISTLGKVQIYSSDNVGIITATSGISTVFYYGDGKNLSNVIVGLGTQTFGDYVQSITGTSNQINVSVTSGEGSTPVLSIPNQFTAPQDATVTRDLQVNRNLNVTGNITIGGTNAFIDVQTFRVSDSDIILGFRTDAFGNESSNDTTANHGGIAIASTEGSPIVDLNIIGIETLSPTYKKIMWFKSGAFAGLGTDAWMFNYAVGIGSTQFPAGIRLAAGNIQFTQNDLAAVRNINSSGIITATKFAGDGSEVTNIEYSKTSGVSTDVSGGTASVLSLTVSGISTLGITSTTNLTSNTLVVSGVSTLGVVQISSGIITAVTSGIVTYYGDGRYLTGITGTQIVSQPFTSTPVYPILASNAGVSSVGISTVGSNALVFIPSTGNLGVGTTSPISKLHVIGDGFFSGVVTATTFYGSGANLTGLIPNAITTSSASTPQYIGFSTTNSGVTTSILASDRLVYIPSSGNLGIGTTNPKSKLDVFGNVRLSADTGIGTTSSAGPSLTFIGVATQFNYAGVANTNAVEIKAYARDNGTLSFNGYGNQILTLNDNFNTEAFVVSNYIPKPYSFVSSGLFAPTDFIEQAFRIDRAGNTIVGIGTSIGAKLDVRGSVILGVAHTATTTQLTTLGVTPQRINGDTTIFGKIIPKQPFSDTSSSPTSNHIIMSPTTGDTGSLNFFVGTASTTRIPDQILSLTNNVSGSLFRVNNPTVGFSSATNLSIGQNIATIFEVNSNGNVGVGTSVPNSTLHVQGNTMITGITTLGLSSSSSPTINSTMSFELTNNNTLTVRVKGTDGTVRTGTIALVP